MKCPYCVEEIKDEAVVCRFCQRDLAFIRPLLDRLSKIEEVTKEIRFSLEDVKSDKASNSDSQTFTPTSIVVKCTVALGLSIILAFTFCWISWHFETSSLDDGFLSSMSSFVPFFVAIGLGASLPRIQWFSYVLLGSLTGLAGFVQVQLLSAVYLHGQLSPSPSLSFVIHITSGVVSFLLGGYVGERIRGEAVPQKPSELLSPGLTRLLGNPQTAAQVSSVIKLWGPVLGQILSAIFLAIYGKK